MDASANKTITAAIEKAGLKNEFRKTRFVLCEVKSNGEKIIYKDNDVSITTSISINGRLFLTPFEHLDALTPIAEQVLYDNIKFNNI